MYSGNVFTSVRNSRDNSNVNKNMTGNNSLNNDTDNRMGREKGVHRLWDILSSALEDTADVRCNKKEAFCTIINSFGYPLTPLTVAEMIVLIGKLIASKGKTDKEQYETTATALVDVIDSLTTLNWDAVFWSLPMIDPSLKITSIECFAFVVAVFHTQKNCETRFPVEIGFQEKWQSSLSQALFLKWIVMSVGATSTPTLYQRIPFLVYLRYVEVPGDATHMKMCPPLFSNDSSLISLWSNSHLVLALANVAIHDTNETTSNGDAEQTEAARIAIELLKRPTVNFSDVFLATLVKCEELFLALSRFLAYVCINQLWQMLSCNSESQHLEPQDFMVYLRGLASLSPIRFGSVVLASLYPRHGERIEFVIAALQPNVRLLGEVLQGTSAPFCFHVFHLAKVSASFPVIWLKERLNGEDYETAIKDFIFFLMLALCPAKLFQQHQQKISIQLTNSHPLRRLHINGRDLLLYLYMVAETLCQKKSSLLSLTGTSQNPSNVVAALSSELYSISFSRVTCETDEECLKDIYKVKQIISKLVPSLATVLEYIQPSDSTTCSSLTMSETLNGKIDSSGSIPNNISNEIEAEVHKQFSALFSSQISCDTMIFSMEQMAKTPQSMMYKVFDSMIRLLFHECRFFQKYPLAELAITAEFMGMLIQSGLLLNHGSTPGESHLWALQFLVDSLKKDTQSKFFRFAVTAMEHCITQRLCLCPNFLRELATGLPEVAKHFPTYSDFAQKCLQVIPSEYHRQTTIIDPIILADLPLPVSPTPVIYPEFSLTRHRTQQPETSCPTVGETVPVPSSFDGCPPQRLPMIDGRLVMLGDFGLGMVEKLLSSDPALNCFKPPQWFCDQFSHTLNSLVITNVQQKAHELRSVLQTDWNHYIALSIVRSRVAKETKFHDVYLRFLEALGWPKLMETVISVTYDCINILLCYCDNAKESLSYRKLLKNLGSWLGFITLAQNKPLMSKCLDLKNLILDACEHDRLSVILPLCCKILEAVRLSKNFRPPNPWCVALLSLLTEIHEIPGLPTSFLFELELLFQNIGVSMNEFKGRTTHLLQYRHGILQASSQETYTKEQSTTKGVDFFQDTHNASKPSTHTLRSSTGPVKNSFNAPRVSASHSINDSSTFSSHFVDVNTTQHDSCCHDNYMSQPMTSTLDSDAALVRAFCPPFLCPMNDTLNEPVPNNASVCDTNIRDTPSKQKYALLKALSKSVIISPSVVLFKLKPLLKTVIPQALENAIREIVQVVAERSVTISCVTAKEIVLKDFSAEVNENLIHRAAQLFVASLAGSIALVTCRQPLRAAFNQHIRHSLLAANRNLAEDQRLVDQVVSVTTADNIELGCALVEEAVVQLSIRKVKEVLHSSFLARQQALQNHVPWVDPVHSQSRWLSLLPPALQPKPISSAEQLEVYKDFFLLGPLQRMQNHPKAPTQDGLNHCTSETQTPSTTQYPVSETHGHPDVSSHPDMLLNNSSTINGNVRESLDTSYRPSLAKTSLSEATVELQAVMMRVEESLSHIKDMVYEIAFSSPTIKLLPSTVSQELVVSAGCSLNVIPIPETVNIHVAMFAWLPSDHDIFGAIMNTSLCCTFYTNPDVAFINVCRRAVKMINEFAILYRETPVVIRLSNVAGLYLDVFLALLTYMRRHLLHSTASYDEVITTWLADIIFIRMFGPAVAMGLLRYNLITFTILNDILHKLLLQTTSHEKTTTSIIEATCSILFQIVNQDGIQILDITSALKNLSDTIQQLQQYPVNDANTETYPNPSSEVTNNNTSLPIETNHSTHMTLEHFLTLGCQQMKQYILNRISMVLIKNDEPPTTPPTLKVSTLTELLDSYATIGGPVIHIRSLPVPVELTALQRQSVASCFTQWTNGLAIVDTEERSNFFSNFFQVIAKQQIMNLDEQADIFLTGYIEHAVELVIKEYPDDLTHSSEESVTSDTIPIEAVPETECSLAVFKPLNTFAMLIVALMRSSDFPYISSLLILQRTLSLIIRCIYRDLSKTNVSRVNNLVYYGLLVNLLSEVTQPTKELGQQMLSILVCFSNAFLSLSPCECPSFAFCWLELIAHPCFLPGILAHVRAWPHFQKLLCRFLRFLYPFHQRVISSPGILAISKGALRLLLVLLHDFPEFLCEHHVLLIENIPFNSIQLRNLVLSAFPRNVTLPDPFIANLKADFLPETRKAPRLYGNFSLLLTKYGIKQNLELYRKTQDVTYVKAIVESFKITNEKSIEDLRIHYNVTLINAMALYLVSQFPMEKEMLDSKTTQEPPSIVTKFMYQLIEEMDLQGRYITISCLSNNLRYPNMHTHYFSSLILWLFSACSSIEMVQEQITRVLLERLIAHRPHPWGLLITFIELMKNSRFNFWACPFIHSVSDVQYLFQSVAQTCLGQPSLLQSNKCTDMT